MLGGWQNVQRSMRNGCLVYHYVSLSGCHLGMPLYNSELDFVTNAVVSGISVYRFVCFGIVLASLQMWREPFWSIRSILIYTSSRFDVSFGKELAKKYKLFFSFSRILQTRMHLQSYPHQPASQVHCATHLSMRHRLLDQRSQVCTLNVDLWIGSWRFMICCRYALFLQSTHIFDLLQVVFCSFISIVGSTSSMQCAPMAKVDDQLSMVLWRRLTSLVVFSL